MINHTRRKLAILLSVAALLRLTIALHRGQYFDWDEHRYGFSTLMLERVLTGDVSGALDILFRYPEHPGFKIVGLIPALLHMVSGAFGGHPISDMRYPSGEWLPAFVFSLGSVCSIGFTYAIARRSGAKEDESFFAAFLMFASTNMIVHATHFFPYDAAMAMFLAAIWLVLDERPRPLTWMSAGALVGAGFATYEGFWLLAIAVAVIHLWYRPGTTTHRFHRAVWFGIGGAIVPLVLVLLSASRGRRLIDATLQFSHTVTHGEYSEGWTLPWEYFWNVEHGLLLVVLAGLAIGAIQRSARVRFWLIVASLVYAGLVAGSNVAHRLVVYDRLARQLWPFLCLAAGAGFAAFQNGRWVSGRNAIGMYTLVTALFAVNLWPIITQRYPRDVVQEVFARYGAENVALETNVHNAVDSTTEKFLPPEALAAAHPPAAPVARRYVLLNARDLWIEGEPASKEAPAGTVIAVWRHPRQVRALQYHGYSPAERQFIRATDVSMRLIDIRPDRK